MTVAKVRPIRQTPFRGVDAVDVLTEAATPSSGDASEEGEDKA